MKYPFVNLSDPQLGSQLLKEARHMLPSLVWGTYVWKQRGGYSPLLDWADYSEPDAVNVPLEPKQAMDEAKRLVRETMYLIAKRSTKKALDTASLAWLTLARGSSWYERKRGQPASMRPVAVRAYVIRKFNPAINWDEVADLLFLENRKCPRTIQDDDGRRTLCGVPRHQYDSPCVKALRTAVNHLKSAMKHDGLPV